MPEEARDPLTELSRNEPRRGGSPADPEPRHLFDYAWTLYRHRWGAATAFVVVFLGVALRTFTATSEYKGRAQIQIDPDPNIVDFKRVSDLDKRSLEYYQTQLSVLKSRALARRTIDSLNLWGSAELGDGPPQTTGLARAARRTFDAVAGRSPAPDAAAAPTAPTPDETAAQSRAIDALLGRLSVEPIPDTRLVEVRVSSASPEAAASLTNTLVKMYIQQSVEAGSQSSREANNWLGQQLEQQRKKVEDSERALQDYREKSSITLDDRQNIVVLRLNDLNSAVIRARAERLQKEALYQQIVSMKGDRGALDTIPAIQSNGFIQSLKLQLSDLQRQRAQLGERLGDNHPNMVKLATAIADAQAKLQVELDKAVESVHNQYLAALAEEQSLAREFDTQKERAAALNRSGVDYDALRREAESNKKIYDSLMQRAKETGITGELKSSNIRIVDLAEVPRRPARPNKTFNLLLGLLAGVLSGVGFAAFVEYLDNRIKNPDDIKRHLGLPFLGLLPDIPPRDRRGAPPLLTAGVPVGFSEAMRAIRTNVLFSSAQPGCRSIVVTSTQPGEGKSVISANLALSLAQTGKRVLLIDGDMRKPQLQVNFNVPLDPGLSNAIVGTAKSTESIVRSPAPNLWLLPAGLCPPNPAELLGAARFKSLLDQMSAHFDYVVIDSPPVLAVTDVSVFAYLMTGVIFVIGSEQTTRQAAVSALEQLHAAQAHVLGAVLNRVDVSSNRYYYSHYYKRTYAGHYRSESRR